MKEIITRFVEKYKDVKFNLSYCDVEDLDAVVETNLERRHLIISNFRQDLNIIRSNHAFAPLFKECTERLEFDGAVYLHEPIVDKSQFIVSIDLKTGVFKTVGHARRSQILEVLDRLSVILDALKFYESQKSVETEILNATYPWLDFSWRGMNKDKFNLDPKSSKVGGWFVLDRNGIWDLTVELNKPTLRLMKRHLPKKIRHRRNRQTLNAHDRLTFDKYLIDTQTCPVKKGAYRD